MNDLQKNLMTLGRFWGAMRGTRARVLLYHSISDSPHDPFSVSPQMFSEQMKWLHENGVKVFSAQALVFAIQRGEDLSRTTIITFDDALLDFFEIAIPILNTYHFPATVFVPTGRLGQDTDWVISSPVRKVMSQQQLIRAAEMGFELGSHTVNHASLPDVDASTLRLELTGSLQYLYQLTKQNRISIAFPYGRGGVREQTAACTTGFLCAFLAGGLFGAGKGSNLFALPRELIHWGYSLKAFAHIFDVRQDFRKLWVDLSSRKSK